MNAKIFYDKISNKTYLGAILVSKDNFQVTAEQHHLVVNNDKLDWNSTASLEVQGHRIVVVNNTAAVTFKGQQVTLGVRRHVTTPTPDIDAGYIMNDGAEEDKSRRHYDVMTGDDPRTGSRSVNFHQRSTGEHTGPTRPIR